MKRPRKLGGSLALAVLLGCVYGPITSGQVIYVDADAGGAGKAAAETIVGLLLQRIM